MGYHFTSQQKATAFIHQFGDSATYKILGVNGEQTNADNFRTALAGVLHVVGKDNDVNAGIGRTISQDVEADAGSLITLIPSSTTATAFGGRVEYDEQPYVKVRIQYAQGEFENPTFTAVGNIPIQSEGLSWEDFDEDNYAGTVFKIIRTTETVTAGTGTKSIVFTVTEGNKTATATFTIDAMDGDGYAVNQTHNY